MWSLKGSRQGGRYATTGKLVKLQKEMKNECRGPLGLGKNLDRVCWRESALWLLSLHWLIFHSLLCTCLLASSSVTAPLASIMTLEHLLSFSRLPSPRTRGVCHFFVNAGSTFSPQTRVSGKFLLFKLKATSSL